MFEEFENIRKAWACFSLKCVQMNKLIVDVWQFDIPVEQSVIGLPNTEKSPK